jgi:hypothetical protein
VSAADWLGFGGIAVAGLGVGLPLRYSMRKDAAERAERNAEAIRQAVLDATAPLIADRDFYRNRVSQLEDQLRKGMGSD